ncbi:hypothetical protein FJTKL_14254 [Diaporthe vaccinii]|uniref:Uncharacterized protein n=1 Tax=Diaporthe vaccinii TaxID=105482 RepID=A0ABR4E8M2_9PEZI
MTDGRKNEMFSRNLGLDSQYLPELNKDFGLAFGQRNLSVIAVYETKDSNTVEQKEDGRWSRTGPPVRMVPQHSACTCGIPSDNIASFTNHSNLAKNFRQHEN